MWRDGARPAVSRSTWEGVARRVPKTRRVLILRLRLRRAPHAARAPTPMMSRRPTRGPIPRSQTGVEFRQSGGRPPASGMAHMTRSSIERPAWSRTSAPASGSDRPRVRLGPGRRCHRRSREQYRGPGSDRQREQVREDERAQSHACEGRRCPRSVTPRPGLDAPEATDQQNDAPERPRTGARRDCVADDQGAARDRRCGHGTHARQRSAVSV